MRVRAEQLANHLASSLAPIYLLAGDEPLQMAEAGDAIRAAARAQGFDEREVMHVDGGFDWNALSAAADSLSLFASRRLLELRLPSGKPGDVGARALTAYAERPAEDTVLLISSGKLDSRQQKSKWFRALEGAGVFVPVWPVDHNALPRWVTARMQARGLQPEAGAAELLAERVEGNLLAAAQEVEKLYLLHGAGSVDAEAVAAAVADSSRFTVFELVDAAVGGDAARAVRMLDGLRAEGMQPPLVVWALVRELRALATMAADIEAGQAVDAVLRSQRVWEKRKGAVRSALSRHRATVWRRLLQRAARIDRIAKGAESGNAWDELLQLTLLSAGVRPFRRGPARPSGNG